MSRSKSPLVLEQGATNPGVYHPTVWRAEIKASAGLCSFGGSGETPSLPLQFLEEAPALVPSLHHPNLSRHHVSF